MCSTAKNKVSCLIICHVWFSLNNDHRAIWHSAQTHLWLHALTWRSNQDFRVRGRKRHTTSPFFTELIISLFPYYFFDLKGFFFYLGFLSPSIFMGECKYGQEGVMACLSKLCVNTQCKTSQQVLHTQWSEGLNVWWFTQDQPDWISGSHWKSEFSHPVFRDASINLC